MDDCPIPITGDSWGVSEDWGKFRQLSLVPPAPDPGQFLEDKFQSDGEISSLDQRRHKGDGSGCIYYRTVTKKVGIASARPLQRVVMRRLIST